MEIIIAVIPCICTALCSYLVWWLKRRFERHSNIDKILIILMRTHLRELYKLYTSDEFITPDEFAEFQELYDLYHEMGGNGTATKMMDEIKKLKMRDGENQNEN